MPKIEYHEKLLLVRDSECPIVSSMYDNKDYEDCQKCSFFRSGNCETERYITIIEHTSFSDDDDDDFGGMPSTDYCYKFPCARCGATIEEHSGMSTLCHLDHLECKNCKTVHVLIKGGYNDATFLVPIRR